MAAFSSNLQRYGYEAYRDMPWRSNTDPYWVWISEIMLQQTQVSRVIPKFEAFIDRFPDIQSLAAAELRDVLQLWIGLGYNRRAKFIHQAAKHVVNELDGVFPGTYDGLQKLPGVGPNTAGAIMAYAYNQPIVYVETNIRSVFIHEFFNDRRDVDDKEILPLIDKYIDRANPREWYWALMDYGSYLKKTKSNPSRKSKHHIKQTPFEGSKRQLRAKIVRLHIEGVSLKAIRRTVRDPRLEQVIQELQKESMI